MNKTVSQCVYISGWLTCINVLNHLFKVQDAENDTELQAVFGIDEAQALLYETGFTKALLHLAMEDRNAISSILINYHCMTKVKQQWTNI